MIIRKIAHFIVCPVVGNDLALSECQICNSEDRQWYNILISLKYIYADQIVGSSMIACLCHLASYVHETKMSVNFIPRELIEVLATE